MSDTDPACVRAETAALFRAGAESHGKDAKAFVDELRSLLNKIGGAG